MTVDIHSLNNCQTINGHTIEPMSCNINGLYLMNSLLCFVKNKLNNIFITGCKFLIKKFLIAA